MPSSFNSTELFNSGPHRFHLGPCGEQLIEQTALDPTTPGRQAIGPLDGSVTVRGRLVAATDADLWSILESIQDQLTDPPTTADLIDSNAHTFSDMSFISFTPLAPFERGRTVSVPYEAIFTHFGGWK